MLGYSFRIFSQPFVNLTSVTRFPFLAQTGFFLVLAASLGRSGALLWALGSSCGLWGRSGPVFAHSWPLLGCSWPLFGRSWAVFGPLGPLLGALGALLGHSWGALGALLGRSWV